MLSVFFGVTYNSRVNFKQFPYSVLAAEPHFCYNSDKKIIPKIHEKRHAMKQYEMFELSFDGVAHGKELVAEFSHGEKRVYVPGFYDGNGVYRFRFLPEEAGIYRWTANGESGAAVCEPADGTRHGVVMPNGLHLRYSDGERFSCFGTTVYALAHQPDELVRKTISSLKSSPFNKVRFCVFPKHYDYNHNEPELYAFEKTDGKWDTSKPCYQFWRRFEAIIDELGKSGIECDIILFHPYDRWGFSRLTKGESLEYLDYAVRRLSAYPNVWWSLANEYDLMDNYTLSDWKEFAEYISDHDICRHMLSNHNCFSYFDFSISQVTHCSIQDIFVCEVPELQRKYRKPVIFDECCYEGNISFGWGNISAFEMVNRFWTAVISGGYCTHGETYMSDDDVLWWSRGGELKGKSPSRIAFLRSIVESLPGDIDYFPEGVGCLTEEVIAGYRENGIPKDLIHDFWVKGLCSLPAERVKGFILRSRGVTGACMDDSGCSAYIKYYGRQCPSFDRFILPDGSYKVEVIDAWEMTRTVALENASGEINIALPGKEGIAVLAVRIK